MARELYRCTLCDDKIEKAGRYGHIRFSDGNGHGPKGEVPDDPEKYFVEYDSETEQEMEDKSSGNNESTGTDEQAQQTDSTGSSSTSESGKSKGKQASGTSTEDSSSDSDSGNGEPADGTDEATDEETNLLDRFVKWLTTPVKGQ